MKKRLRLLSSFVILEQVLLLTHMKSTMSKLTIPKYKLINDTLIEILLALQGRLRAPGIDAENLSVDWEQNILIAAE